MAVEPLRLDRLHGEAADEDGERLRVARMAGKSVGQISRAGELVHPVDGVTAEHLAGQGADDAAHDLRQLACLLGAEVPAVRANRGRVYDEVSTRPADPWDGDVRLRTRV